MLVFFVTMPALGKSFESNVKTSYKKIKTLSADVKISTYSNVIGYALLIQDGILMIKYPDKFRLEIVTPKKHTSVLSGNKYLISDLAFGATVKSALPNSQYIDASKAATYFDLKNHKLENNHVLLKSRPIDKKAPIEIAFIYLNPKTYLPEKIILKNISVDLSPNTDKNNRILFTLWLPFKIIGDITRNKGIIRTDMTLNNIKINAPMNNSLFNVD